MSTLLSSVDSRDLALGFHRVDGKVYNFNTKGWDDPAGTGVPTTQQFVPFVRMPGVAGSPLSKSQHLAVSQPVTDNAGYYAAVYVLTAGAVSDAIDTLDSLYLFGQQSGVKLSVGRHC